MRQTVNGKNETFAVSLQLWVQWSEIICICNKKLETLFHFCVVYLRIRRKELKSRSKVNVMLYNLSKNYFCL